MTIDGRPGTVKSKYGAILADPPWAFRAYSGYRIPSRKHGGEQHYETMTIEDIAALPVSDYAADDCALFCWVVWPSMPEALKVIEAWGFTYKTCAFCWNKGNTLPLFPDDFRNKMGLGYWTRANSEVSVCWPRAASPSVSTPTCARSSRRRSGSTPASPMRSIPGSSGWSPGLIWRCSRGSRGPAGIAGAMKPRSSRRRHET